jgi:hypothetical protein
MPKKKGSLSGERINDIEGIIIPVRWDNDGNPITVALATSQEEEFPINMEKKKGKKLLEFLQKKVKITGSMTTQANNQKMVTIQKYQLIAYDEFEPNNNDVKLSF